MRRNKFIKRTDKYIKVKARLKLLFILSPLIFLISNYAYQDIRYSGVVLKSDGQLIHFAPYRSRGPHTVTRAYWIKIKNQEGVEKFWTVISNPQVIRHLKHYRGHINISYEKTIVALTGNIELYSVVTDTRTFRKKSLFKEKRQRNLLKEEK